MILKVIYFIAIANIYYILLGAVLLMGFVSLDFGYVIIPEDYDKWKKSEKALYIYKAICEFPVQIVKIITGIE